MVGPGYEGSLIRGDAARPMTGFNAARRANSSGDMVAALDWSVAVSNFRQPDEPVYGCASR